MIALYTVSTNHFNMDSRLFCGIMASHGFQPNEFCPRAAGTKLPPPFDTGPPLGQGLAGSRNEPAPPPPMTTSEGSNLHGGQADGRGGQGEAKPASTRIAKHTAKAYIGHLEQFGEALVQDRSLSQSLVRLYPFLLQSPDELFVKDVKDLLEQYRSVVLKYEGLKAALAVEGPR
jgi:hypothetical protein